MSILSFKEDFNNVLKTQLYKPMSSQIDIEHFCCSLKYVCNTHNIKVDFSLQLDFDNNLIKIISHNPESDIIITWILSK